MDSKIQAARQARRDIEWVRKQLLTPTPGSLAACGEPLKQAIQCMSTLQSQILQAEPGEGFPSSGGQARLLRDELAHLQRELAVTGALLNSAAEFHEGWAKLLRPDPAWEIDYSASGRASSRARAQRVSLHG